MFNSEFYPTPESVLEMMGIDCINKTVLEPSAGKGDIVDYCKKWGAKEVLACEIHPELRQIVSTKANVIGTDFFKINAEEISHVELIVMNPPFSNADRHILHAWSIAPEGCEIIALCNYETIEKNHYGCRRELVSLVNDYGESMFLGDVFSSAERKTGVNVGMVRLFKPMISDNGMFDDFYFTNDDVAEDNAMVSYNEMRAIVNTYTAAVRCFEKVEEVGALLKSYTNVSIIGNDDKVHRLEFGRVLSFTAVYREEGLTTKAQFAKAFQMKCWQFIFDRVGIEKYVTKGVLSDINQFINNRKNYPFTIKNISKMLDIIMGTRGDIMNRAIVEAVDNFTRHTNENRFGVEGWKTNAGHLLNKKFIVGYIAASNWGKGLQIEDYKNNFEQIKDLTKALCYLTGKKYEEIPHVRYSSCQRDDEGKMISDRGNYVGENCFTPNVWYEWAFFEFKVFKKGTGHFKFKNIDDWAVLNRAYAKIKGQVLPEKFNKAA